MCLLTLQDKPFVAEKDIVCYKRLVLNKSDRFVTPVIGRNIQDAVISGRRLYKARGIFMRSHKSSYFPYLNVVDKGWIHTFTTSPTFFNEEKGVWFECVIPKGTKFWKSNDGEEYASRSIRFVKLYEDQIRALYADCFGGARCPTEDELSDIVGSIKRTKEFFKKTCRNRKCFVNW